MFAQHLRMSRGYSRSSDYSPVALGDYLAGVSERRIVASGAGIKLYGDISTNSRQSVSFASKGGIVGLSDRWIAFPGGGNNVNLYAATANGLGALLSSFPKLASVGISYIAGNLLVFVVIDNADLLVTVRDLSTGSTSGPTRWAGYATAPIISSGDNVYWPVSATSISGTTNRNPRTFLLAGGGRAARCRITRSIYEEAPYPVIYRQSVDGLQPVYIAPFRRPMTTASFARAYDVSHFTGSFVRRSVLYRRAVIRTYEVEVGPSMGLVEISGVRYTRHMVSVFDGSTYGCLKFDGSTARSIRLGDSMSSGTVQCLQYLNAGDVPSGEFIIESLGRWLATDGVEGTASGQLIVPSCVTMNNIVQPNAARDRLEVYDLNGNFVETTSPPGFLIAQDWDVSGSQTTDVPGALFHAQNADALIAANGFNTPVPVTFDCGRTWSTTTVSTGSDQPGTSPLTIPANVLQQKQILRAVTTWRPLFIT